jgi:glycosyltransferase involved in cell wall biosynthesis
LKILHIVPTYVPAWRYGGPIRSIHALCRALAKKGHQVDVFTTNKNGAERLDIPVSEFTNVNSVRVMYFECNQWLDRIYYSRPMKKALQKEIENYDVIHLHSVYLWPTLMAARICFRAKKPYLISPRGMLIGDLIRKKNSLIKKIYIYIFESRNLKNASMVHCTSHLEELELRNLKIGIPSVCVIGNGLLEETEDEYGINNVHSFVPPPENYLLFVGRLNWKKGLDRLIKAMPIIKDHILVIVGNDEDGYLAELKKICISQNVQDRIHFYGEVVGVAKEKLIRGSSMLILPSYSENFGNVLLEAMAFGKAVGCTPEVGLAEVISKNNAGIVLPIDSKEMGKNLNTILGDKKSLLEMGQNGRILFEREFDWSKLVIDFEKMYKKVLGVC